MAGDWIKVDIDTAHKPEVLKLARLLGVHKAHAFGLVVTFWGWADKNTANGEIIGVTEEDIDIFLLQPGFAKALQEVGWLQFDAAAQRLIVPSFEIHNSESAKRRAQATRRQTRWRSHTPAADAPKKRPHKGNGSTTTDGFEEFYAAYPRRVGRAKAEQAWRAIKPDDTLRARIMAAIAQHKKSEQWSKDNGKFIPHPTSWLHGKRWEDELKPAAAPRFPI